MDPSIWTRLFGHIYLDLSQLLVLWLQVPVTDLLEVQVLDSRGNLEEVQLSLGLFQLCLLYDPAR